MKRLFMLITALLFVILMISCSQDVSEEFSLDIEDVGDDFGGYTVNIIQDKPKQQLFIYTENHIIADLLKVRIDEIADNYNILTEITGVSDGGTLMTAVTNAMAVGDSTYDMMYTSTSNCASTFSYAGYLYPYSALAEYVDLDDYDKYGSPNLYELAMYNNEQYIIFPMYWPEKSTAGNISNIFVINEILVQKYGVTDPREYFENGQWTTQLFSEVTPDYTINDGEIQVKTFASNLNGFARSVMTCNGLKSLVYADGKISSGLLTDEARNIMDWARDYTTINADCITFIDDWHPGEELVANEVMLALTEPLYILSDIAPYLDNFGCVPFPTGPDTTVDNYGSFIIAMEGFSVMNNTESPEACGFYLNKMLEPLPGYETREDLINYLYKSIFFTYEDAELYYDYARCSTYDYWTVGGNAIISYVSSNLSTKTGAEIIEACDGLIDETIDDYISTNYEYMNEYYESKQAH